MPDVLVDYALVPAVKIFILLFLAVLPVITYLVLFERRVIAAVRDFLQ